MENNQQPASEVSSHDEQQVQSQQQPRSYECNFCKKGFSNAQALGGHMNIHRKDKAKLNQASKESQRSLMDTTSTLAPSRSNTKPLDITSGRVKSNAAKWPCIYSSSHDHLLESSYSSPRVTSTELKQLPLFVEKVSGADYSNPVIHASANWPEDSHTSHGSFGADLDLELRLGHVPPKPSVSMGTRKFFG